MSEQERDKNDGVLVIDRPPSEEREKLEPPSMYAVVMLNDDFTPMDFVVALLIQQFNKSQDEAEAIMVNVHEKGKGIAGTFSKEIAETKVYIANELAQRYEHPFKCQIEKI